MSIKTIKQTLDQAALAMVRSVPEPLQERALEGYLRHTGATKAAADLVEHPSKVALMGGGLLLATTSMARSVDAAPRSGPSLSPHSPRTEMLNAAAANRAAPSELSGIKAMQAPEIRATPTSALERLPAGYRFMRGDVPVPVLQAGEVTRFTPSDAIPGPDQNFLFAVEQDGDSLRFVVRGDNDGAPALYDYGTSFYLNRIDISPEGYTSHQRHELNVSEDLTAAQTGPLPRGVYRLEVRPTEQEPSNIWDYRGERGDVLTSMAYRMMDANPRLTPELAQLRAENAYANGVDEQGTSLSEEVIAHRDVLAKYDHGKLAAGQAKGFTVTTTAGPSDPQASWIKEVGGIRDDSGKFIKAKVVVNLLETAKEDTTIRGTLKINGDTQSFTMKVAKGRASGLASIQTNVPSSRGDAPSPFAPVVKLESLNGTNDEMRSHYGWWQWVEDGANEGRFSPADYDKTGPNFGNLSGDANLSKSNSNAATISHADPRLGLK